MTDQMREAWLRGPIPGVPDLLMPAAHAIVHAREDTLRALDGLGVGAIWARPGGAPPVGYHVRHLVGALDRLFTYARGAELSGAQQAALAAESAVPEPAPDAATLAADIEQATARAIDALARTDPQTLIEPRGVGRRQLPSTVIGLLFHGAEHAARHAGQALTTSRIARAITSD